MLFYGRVVFAVFISESDIDSLYKLDAEQEGILPPVNLYNSVVSETIKITSPVPAQDGRYGTAVAIDGDTIAVGAPADNTNNSPGYVHIRERNAGGPNNWGIIKTLSDTESIGIDGFGVELVLKNDTLLVGAHRGTGITVESGTVFIFERDYGGVNNWGLVARLQASDGAYGDRFGWTFDITGDTVAVGARWDDHSGGFDAGSVYIFERNEGGPNNWGQVRKITASDPGSSDLFGVSLALQGNTLAIGAEGQDKNGNQTGLVYLLDRDAGGFDNWGEVKFLSPRVAVVNDRFGADVAMADDLLAVSAPQNSTVPGVVYLFKRHEDGVNNWGQIAGLTSSDGESDDQFGSYLDLDGNQMVIGASNGEGISSDVGVAYIFAQDELDQNLWYEKDKLVASDGEFFDEFGRRVGISGDTVVVGAFRDDDFCPQNPNCDSGAVYIYSETPSANVNISKSSSSVTVLPGQPITYTLTFGNDGPDTAFNTVITDLVPTTVQNPTFVSSGALITQAGSIPFTWQVQDLAPGESGIITLTGIISPDLETEMTLTNTVEINNSWDVTLTNNVATAVSQVIIPEISFSQSSYTVDESAGSITITAVLSPAQPFMDVFVDYQIVEGTAVSGEDYTPVSGTLTFPAGISETTFTIPIINDDIVETDEVFSVTIANAVHGQIHNATLSVTILDDDALPEDSFVYLPIIINAPALPESEFPIFIGDVVAARPVTAQGEVFFSTTVDIPETIPETGQFFLSRQPEQLYQVVVDDEFVILWDGEEVFTKNFSSYGQPPQPAIVEIPRSLLLSLAGHEVTVNYRDVYAHSVSASPIWLRHLP